MAEFPALPLFTDAYIADTAHLTNEEHGVYLRLLMFAWRTEACALPDNDARLALMVGVTKGKWNKLKPSIMAFWKLENEEWTQKKLTSQRTFVSKQRKQKSFAGKESARLRALKTLDTAPTAVAPPLPTAPQQPITISKTITTSNSSKEEYVAIDEASEAVSIYNGFTELCGWPEVQKLTKPRRSAVLGRLKDCGGLDGWRIALDKASKSHFLTGQTPSPFFASFDWLTKPANFTKLMEGNYDNRKSQPTSRNITDQRGEATLDLIAAAAQAR